MADGLCSQARETSWRNCTPGHQECRALTESNTFRRTVLVAPCQCSLGDDVLLINMCNVAVLLFGFGLMLLVLVLFNDFPTQPCHFISHHHPGNHHAAWLTPMRARFSLTPCNSPAVKGLATVAALQDNPVRLVPLIFIQSISAHLKSAYKDMTRHKSPIGNIICEHNSVWSCMVTSGQLTEVCAVQLCPCAWRELQLLESSDSDDHVRVKACCVMSCHVETMQVSGQKYVR